MVIVWIALFALWIYCVFDVIQSDEPAVRNLPKIVWLLVVLLVPTVGSLAWLVLGRPDGFSLRLSGGAPGDSQRPTGTTTERTAKTRPPIGPDDSPDFLRRIEEMKPRPPDSDDN